MTSPRLVDHGTEVGALVTRVAAAEQHHPATAPRARRDRLDGENRLTTVRRDPSSGRRRGSRGRLLDESASASAIKGSFPPRLKDARAVAEASAIDFPTVRLR